MSRRVRAIRVTSVTVLAASFALAACSAENSSEVAQQQQAALSSTSESESATVILSTLPSAAANVHPSSLHRPVAPTHPRPRKLPLAASPVLPVAPSASLSAAPQINFEGQPDTGWAPPDTNGAVSSQFVVSTVNNRITVRDRAGTSLSTTDLDVFWSTLPTTGSSFDTRVRFDPYGQRFIMISAGSLTDAPNSGLLIAVTKTSDPTGAWYQFRIKADPQSLAWLDHPTIGFNKKWVVVSGNMVGADTTVWVFNKAQLYAGNNTYRVLPGVGWTT